MATSNRIGISYCNPAKARVNHHSLSIDNEDERDGTTTTQETMRTSYSAWKSIEGSLAASPLDFWKAGWGLPEPKLMVRGTKLTRVPVDGIAEKEGDYKNPERARQHVYCQQNWAAGLGGGSAEYVLNMNDPSDVNKCAENLFGLHNNYKNSGKHYAGIAIAGRFALEGHLVPSDTPQYL